MTTNHLHSAKSCEHGSPRAGVELARYVLGGLDLDPMSSVYWNHHLVGASRFFDRRTDGMTQAWGGRVWLNPPGGDDVAGTDSLVRPCWRKLVEHWRAGDIEGAVWWGYSLEQLQQLQREAWHPARCVTLLLSVRPRHLVRPATGGPPVEGMSPTHSGFATLLTSVRFRSIAEQQLERFKRRAGSLGAIVRPL